MDIKKSYFDPSFPNSYSGLESFYKSVKKAFPKLKKKQVQTELEKHDAFTLHQPLRKRFKKNQVVVPGIDDTWQADLVDMQKFSKENKGFKYILTVIDVFSKFAYAVPIKNKQGETITEAFTKIFKERKPTKLQVDQGTEFYNKTFKELLKKHSVKMYSVFSEVKACVVERFNRTLKTKMWRMFTHNSNHDYASYLKQLVSSYNNSYHRSIKMRPVDVTSQNESDVWFNLYGYHKKGSVEVKANIKFNVGDLVRIYRYKLVFDKGFTENWSNEIFEITKVIPKAKPVYYIRDLDGDDIKGSFYAEELQRVQQKVFEDESYEIEKVLKTRKNKGVLEKLVKWVGYTEPSWVKASDIQ